MIFALIFTVTSKTEFATHLDKIEFAIDLLVAELLLHAKVVLLRQRKRNERNVALDVVGQVIIFQHFAGLLTLLTGEGLFAERAIF